MSASADFDKVLDIGRPPTIKKLFPNSRALIVSGKAIDRALQAKGRAMTIAANGRSLAVIRGVLRAAQRANAAIILEIAKSEANYCATSMWNLARRADALCNEMGITVPVAIHADHYGIKSAEDVERARTEIPSMFDAGITSIAIDASHRPDDDNLLSNLALAQYIPSWAGYETEVGEIKGSFGLSTPEDALFLIQGLNAHGFCPDWIALNNGTTHGLEDTGQGIQVDLTTQVHDALKPYGTAGAQHGTSGNSSQRLREIADKTNTTKANVATALQMISWGVKVNDDGNAQLDDSGEFIKEADKGVSAEMWAEMKAYADEHGLKGGNYKKLNLPFENRLSAQAPEMRERMAQNVEDFVHNLLANVFNASDTAPLAIEALLKAGSHDLGPKAETIEDPAQWTEALIRERAASLDSDKGPEGDFDD